MPAWSASAGPPRQRREWRAFLGTRAPGRGPRFPIRVRQLQPMPASVATMSRPVAGKRPHDVVDATTTVVAVVP